MRNYIVNVNGTDYQIKVEEIKDGAQGVSSKAAPASKQPAPAPPKPAASKAPAATGGGQSIQSPMPGTILSVNVKQGQAVKSGDVLMILEAMKMENEIMAPCDGTVASLSVSNGATVETGSILCVIG